MPLLDIKPSDVPPETDSPPSTEKPSTAKAKATAKKPVGRPPGSTKSKIDIEKNLTETLLMIGSVVGMVDEYDGAIIVGGSPRLASAIAKKAEQDPRLKAMLEKWMTTSGWAEIAIAAGAMAFPIAVHHGLFPSGLIGVDDATT
jgi:hypothetical protein